MTYIVLGTGVTIPLPSFRRYIAGDMPHLAHSMLIRLETLTAAPLQTIMTVRRFLGLPVINRSQGVEEEGEGGGGEEEAAVLEHMRELAIHPNPNAKYEQR